MKKVLMVGNTDFSIYIYRKELVQRLIEEGYKVYVSSPSGDRVQDMVEMGCEFIETNISSYGLNPFNEFRYLIKYHRIIKSIKPDVILTYTIKPNVYVGIVNAFSNIHFIPNITGLGTALEHDGVLQQITLLLLKISLNNAKIVFFQNKSNLNFILDKGIARGKEYLLPGSGVNLDEHQYSSYPKKGIPIQFSFISRLKKEKGIDYYLDVAKHFSNVDNIIFNVAGFGANENYETILKNLNEQGIIKYWGELKDIRGLLSQTHCVVHPTYYPEGMSNILLESAANGRPIITTKRPGCEEIIDDGINGYVVNIKDKYDLIEKINLFISLPHEEKEKMGLAGRRKMEAEFSREIVTKAYIDEIERLV